MGKLQKFWKGLIAGGAAGVALAAVNGAGARSFMWRRNFLPLSREHRTYAVDLLGFGYSDKPAGAPYSADLYVELIADFIREVALAPSHIIASSLGAAYS